MPGNKIPREEGNQEEEAIQQVGQFSGDDSFSGNREDSDHEFQGALGSVHQGNHEQYWDDLSGKG